MKSCGRTAAALIIGLTVAVGAWSASAPAVRAQNNQELARKVERLEKQLNAVQRQVFPGGDQRYFEAEPAPADTAPDGAVPNGAALVADLQVRIATLERRLRELTGLIEETGFQNKQLSDDVTRFREDVDFRLNQLENGATPSAATAASPNAKAANPPPSAANPEAAVATGDSVPVSPASDPRHDFEAAFALMSRGNYGAAEQGFQKFLEGNAKNPLASNAQYWLGRTYLVQKDYPKAAAAFFAGHRDFPEGAKAADSLLGLATSLFELGQKDEACGALDLMRTGYPDVSTELLQRGASERSRIGCQ